MNNSMGCLISQAQGHQKQSLCWLYYTQAKYANYIVSLPLMLIVILQGPVLMTLSYPEHMSKDIFSYCLLSLVGTFCYGQIDLQKKMLMQLGDYNY